MTTYENRAFEIEKSANEIMIIVEKRKTIFTAEREHRNK